MGRARRLCVLTCALACAACSAEGDRTGLVVLVEQCRGLPPELNRVTAQVHSDTTDPAQHQFDLGSGETSIPFSFGIAPGDAGETARLTVQLEGHTRSSGPPAVTYTATDTGFIDGATLLLDVCLNESRTESRPPSSLKRINPGDELMRDAGMGQNMDIDPIMGGDAGPGEGGRADGSTTCVTECGSAGTCTTDCSPSACDPPLEVCNGEDDDCDGTRDEEFACVKGTTTTCETGCGSTGTISCSGSCEPGSCRPPAEICGNDTDDDCDTQIDEGCMPSCGTSCDGATAVSAPGDRLTAEVSGSSEHEGSCGGSGGPEQAFSFTLQTASDVFATTHGSTVDTVLYLRSCNCTGPEEACNDDADGRATSALQLTDLPAGTYTLFADTKRAMSASIPLDLHIGLPGASGERCSHPLPFDEANEADNTCGAQSDYDASASQSSSTFAGPDHVYYVVVDSASTVSFDTCAGCTSYNSSLGLHQKCDLTNGRAPIVSAGDACKSSCDMAGPPRQGRVETTLDPGVYYLVVDGWGSSSDANCGSYEVVSSGLGN